MDVKLKLNEINVKDETEQTLVRVLMLKGDKGDKGDSGGPGGTTDYNDLINKPTKLSDFANDGVFITNTTDGLINYYQKNEVYNQIETNNLLNGKVDKVAGKGLSTEDYTTAEKNKLANIDPDADRTTVVQGTGNSVTSVMSQNAVTDCLSGKVNTSDLATVAISGSYNDLSNAPNIPLVVQTTGSSTTDVMSQNAVTDSLSGKANTNDLAAVATSGSYNDLSNTPTIPSVVQTTGSSTTDVMSQNSITTELNNKATTALYNATLTSSGWSNAAPYVQTVNISGILTTDTPIADVVLDSNTPTAISQISAWACVSKIETSNGSITATCLENVPTIDIPIQLKVVR